MRRLLAEPRCAFAASDFAGNPRAPWRTATAEVVRGPQLRVIRRLLRAKYGNRFRLFVLVTILGRALGHGRGIGLVLTPDPEFP
ncbi:hypothetical protein [Sciscionella marina]|uniref:hypothetical protein n=1 Tax=Sciscionella marina TaxID=508770 RepID=UPI0003A48C5D|nr:hypothetical protein [Sciscionella marina]